MKPAAPDSPRPTLTPQKTGSAVRGVLGSLLCAFLAAVAWYLLMFGAVNWAWGGKLAILGGFWVGPAACLGYWLCKGLRSRRFAYHTVRICAMLSVVPAFPAVLMLDALPLCGSPSEAWEAVTYLLTPRLIAVILPFSAFLPLLSAELCQKRLMRYTDPAWANDPRSAAAQYAGGLLYNHHPGGIPFPSGSEIPPRFKVGSVLEVDGEFIRTTPSLRREQRFSVKDVAGVVLGPNTGSNVLYDRQGKPLAKFAWSMENAAYFASYLIEQGVKLVPYEDYRPPLS